MRNKFNFPSMRGAIVLLVVSILFICQKTLKNMRGEHSISALNVILSILVCVTIQCIGVNVCDRATLSLNGILSLQCRIRISSDDINRFTFFFCVDANVLSRIQGDSVCSLSFSASPLRRFKSPAHTLLLFFFNSFLIRI